MEKILMVVFAVLPSISCATLAFCNCSVEVAGQVPPLLCATQCVVHSSLSRRICNRGIAYAVQNTRCKQNSFYILNEFVDYRFLNKKLSLVDMGLGPRTAQAE